MNRIGFYDEGQKNINLQLIEGEKTTTNTSTQNDLSLGIINSLTDLRFYLKRENIGKVFSNTVY